MQSEVQIDRRKLKIKTAITAYYCTKINILMTTTTTTISQSVNINLKITYVSQSVSQSVKHKKNISKMSK